MLPVNTTNKVANHCVQIFVFTRSQRDTICASFSQQNNFMGKSQWLKGNLMFTECKLDNGKQ